MLRYILHWTLILALASVVIGCGNRYQTGVRKSASKSPTETTDEASATPETPNEADSETNLEPPDPALLDPSLATEKAPEFFKVKIETTKGNIEAEVTREWSPHGVDRFYNLVKIGFYKNIAIHRAIKGFVFQFGTHGNPEVTAAWSKSKIKDDPHKGIPNDRGYISFAKKPQPNARSTQLFVNLQGNGNLTRQGFTPIALIVKGDDVLDKINTEYGEISREESLMLEVHGNSYIKKQMPNCDFIKSISFIDVASKKSSNDSVADDSEEKVDE